MFPDENTWAQSRLTRRAAIASALAAGGAAGVFGQRTPGRGRRVTAAPAPVRDAEVHQPVGFSLP